MRWLAFGLAILAVVLIEVLAGGGGGRSTGTVASTAGGVAAGGVVSSAGGPRAGARVRVAVVRTGTLPAPVQDAAAAVVGPASFLLLGGIDQGEASVADILRATPAGASPVGVLPTPLHDASASFIGGFAYLFGGGVVASYPTITRVASSGATQPAGRLPTPASDLATTAIGDTVYVVGGYTGVTPLRTILAWRPGQAPRVVATLPKPLRYAAVASASGQLVIAGGTSGESASSDIYRFDPSSGALTRIGRLPSPLTHASAASIGATVLVFGGRSASPGGQTRRILAIAPDGSVSEAGLLPRALSDMAAVALSGRVILAGGRDSSGSLQDTILTASLR
jgi:hypothetical protein